ncbi:MAG: FAD-dependent oxidoreductase [Candidatus Humimicrobiaceae bacterium]
MANNKEYGVIVVGGGTAGAIAALASARKGAKTLLVEQCGYLGGMAAIGMTWGGFFDVQHKQVIKGIPDELVSKAKAMGGGLGYLHSEGKQNWISVLASVEPETYRFLLQQELYEAGCDILLFTELVDVKRNNDKIESIDVANRIGVSTYTAKTFVDATGNADLANLAQAEWETERGDNRQCLTNIFRISNVDIQAFENYMEKEINDQGVEPWSLKHGATMRKEFRHWRPWKKDGYHDMPRVFGVYWHGFEGDIFINCTSTDINPLDPIAVSYGDYLLRKEAFKVFDYLKSKVNGFKDSYLSHIYEIGVRESRRIIGKYQITIDDINNSETYYDRIGYGAYPPDVHTSTGEVNIISQNDMVSKINMAYQIPYRALLPKCISNLIVAGRCISATFEAQSALRGIGPCMVEGEAAGVAAALTSSMNKNTIEIPIKDLQKELQANNVYLGDDLEL